MSLDDVHEYFHESLMAHELLSAKEERALLVRIHKGCKPKKHRKCHSCTERDELVQRNMRLVLKITKRFLRESDPRFTDVASAGTLGLIEGIDRFDIHAKSSNGSYLRFSTYGVWWIQSKIREELGHHDTRVIRCRSYHDIFKKARHELIMLSGDPDVTNEQVFDYMKKAMHWDESKVDSLKLDLERHMIPLETIGESSTPEDHPVRKMMLEESDSILNAAISQLDFDAVYLLHQRYVHDASYEDIAALFGVSRERIRQIENEALRDLWFLLHDKLG